MNVREGAARMQRAGKWLVLIPLAILVLLISAAEVEKLFRHDLRSPFGLIPLFIPFCIPGILLWLAGWIVAGFGKDAA